MKCLYASSSVFSSYKVFLPLYRLDKFQEDVIIAHNKFRGKHHAAPLKWSAGLAEGARQWATALSEKGNLRHSNQPFVGENIWISKGELIPYPRRTPCQFTKIMFLTC